MHGHAPNFNGAFMKRFCGENAGHLKTAGIVIVLLILAGHTHGQGTTGTGSQGFQNATTEVKNYFKYAVDLMYAIGGVSGIVGAIKVYNKWSAGEPDTAKVASSWFGACIFLVVVATILKGFFNL